jgi:hypothetical protein
MSNYFMMQYRINLTSHLSNCAVGPGQPPLQKKPRYFQKDLANPCNARHWRRRQLAPVPTVQWAHTNHGPHFTCKIFWAFPFLAGGRPTLGAFRCGTVGVGGLPPCVGKDGSRHGSYTCWAIRADRWDSSISGLNLQLPVWTQWSTEAEERGSSRRGSGGCSMRIKGAKIMEILICMKI